MPRTANAPVQINVHIPPGVATNLVVTVIVAGVVAAGAVLGTALYGPEEQSKRAFELLDRILRRTPDSATPEPSPTARSRTRPKAREASVRAATLRT